ncbi:MAG: HAD family hydrolase [Bacteroidota bacterium]
MENFEGIIFDIDGTLTSTNELIFAAFNHVTEKYLNRKYTPEELIALFGPTEEQIILELTGDSFPDARKDYFEFYNEHHSALADLYPGIKNILKDLKAKEMPLGIFTGKGRQAAEITLRLLDIFDIFDLIVTGDDVENHKPAPEGILKFTSQFGLNKDRVLLIGDAPADIIAARAAGIKIASVVWDSYAREEVINAGSDYIFYSVGELKNFTDKL